MIWRNHQAALQQINCDSQIASDTFLRSLNEVVVCIFAQRHCFTVLGDDSDFDSDMVNARAHIYVLFVFMPALRSHVHYLDLGSNNAVVVLTFFVNLGFFYFVCEIRHFFLTFFALCLDVGFLVPLNKLLLKFFVEFQILSFTFQHSMRKFTVLLTFVLLRLLVVP